jgi:hypothetical protein
MSLAMFAAPFDDNINSSSISSTNNNIMNKKRQAHTKTQKKYPKENFDTEKVNSFLEKIHNNLGNDDDDDDDTEAFKSNDNNKASEKGKKENMMNMTSNNDLMFRTLGRAPQPNYEGTDNLDLNDYTNYGDNKTNEEYYKRVLPGYNNQPPRNNTNHINKSYYNTANYNPPLESSSSDILLQKLNYMITLLEDQQDERTNNVTEEVVLYSFLGIFIIFIADSFVRVGKYVR